MSRGLGHLQHLLMWVIGQSSKPITFAEMLSLTLQHAGVNDPDRKLHPTRVRALRRALKGLCDSGVLMAVGDGGPSDPYRYCINPLVAAIGGTREQCDKLTAMLQADPGGNVAIGKWMAKHMTAERLKDH